MPMTPVGQPYHAAGPINVRSITATVILGIFTAVFAAGAVWLWEISPIPTLIIFTQFGQALLVGMVLSFAIGRLRMRNPILLLIIGFVCGLASVGLVHLGHYIRFVQDFAVQYREEVEAERGLTPEQKREALAMIEQDPQRVADSWLAQRTGHDGLVGSLMLRNEVGVMVSRAPVTGWALWAIWGAEMLIVAGMAAMIAYTRASEPFCEDCGEWCRKVTAPVVLPGEAAGALADAIRSNDAALMQALRDQPPETTGLTFAGAILYACDGCDLTFADVWQRTDSVKKGKTQSITKTLVKQISISPPMTALLCNVPNGPTEEASQEGAVDDRVAEPAGE
jgi:hypothetical protein